MTALLRLQLRTRKAESWVFLAFLLLQAAVLSAVLFLPLKALLLALAGIAASALLVALPLYPWLIIPVILGTTTLDFTGRVIQTTYIGIPLTGFHLAFLLMLVALTVNTFFCRRFRFPEFELKAPLFTLLGIIAISLTYSPNQPEATIGFLRTLSLIVFLYATQVIIDSKKVVHLVVVSIILSLIGGSILGIFQLISEEFYLPSTFVVAVGANTPRATGTFHNPNTFGTFLMVGVVFLSAIALGHRVRWWQLVFLLCAIGIAIAGLVISFSRANWIAAFVGIVVVLFMIGKMRYLFFTGLVFLISILTVRYYVPFADHIFQRFLSIFTFFEEFGAAGRASSTARIYFVIGGLKMFLDNPILGAGWRAFPVLFEQYKPTGFPYWLPTRESHTLVATIIAELGLAGLTASVWIVWRTLSRALRGFRKMQDSYLRTIMVGLISTFIAFQVSLTFTGNFFNNYLWFFTGMIFAVLRIDRENSAT